MTLLWAITVIEKERAQMTPKLDAAAEVRQACMELDELFRARDIKGVKGGSFVQHGGVEGVGSDYRQKLDDWRTAFKHDRA